MSDAEANSSLPAAPRRLAVRWFQFRLRTLLAAVTLVAAALWAFRVYVEPYVRQRQALEVVKQLGGRVVTAEAGPWQRRLLGADLQNISLIDLADCHQVDEYLPHVAGLPCLETLVVSGEEFTDDHLRRLRLPKLTGLVLDCTSVTDEALAAWQREHASVEVYQSDRQIIEWLSANHIYISGTEQGAHPQLASLVGMEYFRESESLHLALGPQWSFLLRARPLKHLKTLYVNGRWATDAEMGQLHGDWPVVGLGLDGSKVTDAGLVHVGSLTRLQYLDLDRTCVSDAGLAHLASLSRLESLHLHGTLVTDAGLAHLRGLTKLTDLQLSETRITDAGLPMLSPLTKLEYLALNETRITDAGLAHLKGLTHLILLELDGTEVSDAGLVHCRSWPNLGMLWLGDTRVTDAGLAHLRGLAQLNHLNLHGTQVTSPEIRRLKAALPGLDVAMQKGE